MTPAEKIIADALQHAIEWGKGKRSFEDRPPFAYEVTAAIAALPENPDEVLIVRRLSTDDITSALTEGDKP